MIYLERKLGKAFATALGEFPAVLITGPRQAGKSTLVQHTRPEALYRTFDDPLNREFARQDPNGFLDQAKDVPLILDEIQYLPELLPFIKMRIDRSPGLNGRWILTGSQQFALMHHISESLAGRIAILELPPFSLAEAGPEKTLAEIIWNGLYPVPYLTPSKRDLWLKSYLQTYLDRDVRSLENIRNLAAFERFTGLCAAWHSQEFHASAYARDCGVAVGTIQSWARLLTASYLGFMVQPFFNNYGKRLVKAGKFVLADPALVGYLTRQPTAEAALNGPLGGPLFEGLILSEAWKAQLETGRSPTLFFWRSNDGMEVDLILQTGNSLIPIEIKLTATPTARHVNALEKFRKLAGKTASAPGLLVCRVPEPVALPHGHQAIPWTAFPAWLREQPV